MVADQLILNNATMPPFIACARVFVSGEYESPEKLTTRRKTKPSSYRVIWQSPETEHCRQVYVKTNAAMPQLPVLVYVSSGITTADLRVLLG